jgi:hypothetical protein
MAFPSIRDRALSNSTSNGNNQTVNLPSLVIVNDIILIILRVSSAGVIGWPVGWTELFDSTADGSNDRMAAAYKFANGSEGGTTINVTSGNGKFVADCVAVQGTNGVTLGTIAVGNNPSQPNAGNCNPGTAQDFLWFTFYGMEGEQTSISFYPSSYILGQSGIITTSTAGSPQSNCTMGTAARQLNASAQDAGVWNVTGGIRDWMAGTIAFHPIVIPPTPPSSFIPNGGSSLPY